MAEAMQNENFNRIMSGLNEVVKMEPSRNSGRSIPDLADCRPGFVPTEYNILIAPEVIEEKKIGSIIITDATAEAEESRTMKGRLVSVSPLAFNYETAWPEGARPQPGQMVLFAKFGGVLVKGDDGREYRVCKDKDIMGIYNV